MKSHKIVLTLLLALSACAVRAQGPRLKVEWGAMGGVNIVDFSTSMDNTEIKNKLGWQAGIHMGLVFGAFAIEPEILYVRQGMRIREEGHKEVNLKSNSIDVPVLVSFRLLRPVRIFAGPVFTVMNDCKQKSGGDLLDFARVRPTMSYSVGIGATIMRHLMIDLRYNGQFSGKKDVPLPNGDKIGKLRSYNVAISLGYLF